MTLLSAVFAPDGTGVAGTSASGAHTAQDWRTAMEQAQMRDWLRHPNPGGAQSRPPGHSGAGSASAGDSAAGRGAPGPSVSASAPVLPRSDSLAASVSNGGYPAAVVPNPRAAAPQPVAVPPVLPAWHAALAAYGSAGTPVAVGPLTAADLARAARLRRQRVHTEWQADGELRVWIRDSTLDAAGAWALARAVQTELPGLPGQALQVYLNGTFLGRTAASGDVSASSLKGI